MALLHQINTWVSGVRASIIWLCPPSPLTTPPHPHHSSQVTLSNHCCFRNTATILLTWTTFSKSPDVLPHPSGSLLQGPPLSQSLPQFHFILLISQTFIWPCLTLSSFLWPHLSVCRVLSLSLCAPHCLEQSQTHRQSHSGVNSCWLTKPLVSPP